MSRQGAKLLFALAERRLARLELFFCFAKHVGDFVYLSDVAVGHGLRRLARGQAAGGAGKPGNRSNHSCAKEPGDSDRKEQCGCASYRRNQRQTPQRSRYSALRYVAGDSPWRDLRAAMSGEQGLSIEADAVVGAFGNP